MSGIFAAMWAGIALAEEPPPGALAPVAPPAPRADAAWSLGPSFGGGMLVSAAVERVLGSGVRLKTDIGLRWGLAADDVYPNVALTVGAVGAWGPGRVRHGAFADIGASAPLGFFDAWAAAGYALELRDRSLTRRGLLEIGGAVYLVRDLPADVGLQSPAFVHLRYVVPFELGAR